MNITILYGTETGNAEMLSEDIAGELEARHEVNVANLSDFDPAGFDPGRFYLMVCSTYGDGELPGSAQPFAKAMEASNAKLAGIHFAVFGLGDSEYEKSFNGGGKRLAELMLAHGAVQIGERVMHDASGGDLAEDLAFPWAAEMVALASERFEEAA
jgi:MioC protein